MPVLDPVTIRHLIASGSKSGAKGVLLILGFIVAQWYAFGDVQADHTAQIADLDVRIRAVEKRNDERDKEYARDRSAWVWRECLDLYRANHPIPPHMNVQCAAIYNDLNLLPKENPSDRPNI